MSTIAPERTTITPAAPLTADEANSLIALAAVSERTKRVKGGRSTRESRGWSLGGNVD
jgi:hypothetical protein